MRARNWMFVVVGAVAAGLLEATFLTLLPTPWREIRPIIDTGVLLVVLNRTKAGMVFAAVSGFLLDLFSVGPASFAFARLVVVVAIVSLISITVLTNRSLYATAVLVAVARCLDRLWTLASSAIASMLFHVSAPVEPLRSLGVTLLWDIGIVSACFIALALFTRRFLVTEPLAPRPYDDV